MSEVIEVTTVRRTRPFPPPLRFTAAEFEEANRRWGANCGPGAIAAICGLSLDEVRAAMGEEFERKRYTNPRFMLQTLQRLGVLWRSDLPYHGWPRYGLARVQWEGRWTEPGVPLRARYRHTHWVGACWDGSAAFLPGNTGIFDVNALSNGSGWCSLVDWSDIVVPALLEHCVPGANGRWHLTHVLEIDMVAA